MRKFRDSPRENHSFRKNTSRILSAKINEIRPALQLVQVVRIEMDRLP